MITMTVRRQAAAPRERVFAVAADFAHAVETIEAIDKIEVLTSGPVGVGTRFRETRTMFGRSATEEMTVSSFDPPRSYTMSAENHGCRYETVLSFTEKDGGTEMEMRFSAQPLTLTAKLMSFMMRMMTKKMAAVCGKDLEDLARAAEKKA